MHRAERARLAREAALERIRRQQEDGLLTIRQMTPEERERWGPPRDRPTGRKPSYRASLARFQQPADGVRDKT
jgi:hypothetical protein